MLCLLCIHTGELTIRNAILLTSEIGNAWYKLGIALHIPIDIMGNIYGKHSGNSMKALNRVYRYWLADENGLEHTWNKLIFALNYIKEYTVATTVELYANVSLNTRVYVITYIVTIN